MNNKFFLGFFSIIAISNVFAADSGYSKLLNMHSMYEKNTKSYDSTSDISENGGYIISTSNVVFDCKGKTLDGKGVLPTGLLIESYGKNISNITVKNCTFKNYKFNGIRIGWGIPATLKYSIPSEDRYSFHPNNIIIKNVKIINSGTVGLYIDNYVSNVSVLSSQISSSGAPAIYLEFSSKNNLIEANKFFKNGYNQKRGNREALAVDGSFNNTIRKNTFDSNAAGAIFLYKNCQEQFSKGGAPVREDGADYNKIDSNTFINEKIGVWVASRQSRDLSKWDCGGKSMFQNKYYQDYSDYNTVSNNFFSNVDKKIIIEGDYNKVINNKSDQPDSKIVSLPVTKRSVYLNKPQIGNVVE